MSEPTPSPLCRWLNPIPTTLDNVYAHTHTHTRVCACTLHTHTQDLNWGAWDAWSNAPQLRSCNYFVGPWPPFIIRLPYDHPHLSGSRQFAYKTLVARQRPTKGFILCCCCCHVYVCAWVCVCTHKEYVNWIWSLLHVWENTQCTIQQQGSSYSSTCTLYIITVEAFIFCLVNMHNFQLCTWCFYNQYVCQDNLRWPTSMIWQISDCTGYRVYDLLHKHSTSALDHTLCMNPVVPALLTLPGYNPGGLHVTPP